MEPVVVRPVLKADIPQLVGIDHTSSTDHVWQLELRRDQRDAQISVTFREVRLPRPVKLNYPNEPTMLAEDWKRKAAMFVAVAGRVLVGYVTLTEPRSGVAWITDIVVAPLFRRRGVAGALLSQVLKWAAERGCHWAFFEMQSKNYPAIKLAQKHGYEFCGYNDKYYSNQDIALTFVRAV